MTRPALRRFARVTLTAVIACVTVHAPLALAAAPQKTPQPAKTPRATIERKLHDNGAVRTEMPVVDGEIHGTARGFFPSGKRRWEAQFVRGKYHGTMRLWFESGQLESEREYRGGKKHGPFVDYHPNGRKLAEGTYENDELVKLTEWDADGNRLPSEGAAAPAK